MAGLTTSLYKFGEKFVYNANHKPVYRGVSAIGGCNISDYMPNSIGTWPALISTTTDRGIALEFSRQALIRERKYFNQKNPPCVLFRIYLTPMNEFNRKNYPTNVDLSTYNGQNEFSFYATEKEVTLLPFFTF